MGIFAHGIKEVSGKSTIVEDASLNSIMQDSDIDTSTFTEDPEYDGNEVIGTMHENYNKIMENIALNEAYYFERTGEEFIWTEGVFSSFIDTIKKFLKKIWEKIKGLFKRFTMMIDKYNMQDRAFVKKYRKELFTGKDLSDFTFKGYKYTIDDGKIEKALSMCVGTAIIANQFAGLGLDEFDDKNHQKTSDSYENMAEKYRGTILNMLGGKGSGQYTQDEFTKELKEVWRNGESEKEDLDNISINEIANELMSSKETKKTLDTMFKTAKKGIEHEEKEIERKQKDLWRDLPLSAQKGAAKDKTNYQSLHAASSKVDFFYNGKGYKADLPKTVTINGTTHTFHTLDAVASTEDAAREKEASSGGPGNSWDWGNNGTVGQLIKAPGNQYKNFMDYCIGKGFVKEVPGISPGDHKMTNKEYSNRASREFNYYLRAVRDTKAVMMSIQTSCMAALKERSRQNKAICVKVINYNPKSESYNESYDDSYYITSGPNYLSSIELK